MRNLDFLGWFRGCLAVLVTLCFVACGQEERPKDAWVVGVCADNPPFVFVDTQASGDIVGFEPDLVHLLAQVSGKKVILKDMEFGSLIAALQSGRVDMAIASIEMTPDRKKNLDFSNAYLESTTVLVSRKAFPLKGTISWGGLKMGAQLGSAHEAYLKKLELNQPTLKRVAYNRVNEMVQDLENGRLNGFLVEKPVAKKLVGTHAFDMQLLPLSDGSYGIAFPKSSPLVSTVNEALQQVRQRGDLQQLTDKWGI